MLGILAVSNGSRTILITCPNRPTCVIATGQAFENIALIMAAQRSEAARHAGWLDAGRHPSQAIPLLETGGMTSRARAGVYGSPPTRPTRSDHEQDQPGRDQGDGP